MLGWSGVEVGVRHEASPRAFVELGEHLTGESLKRPANAVLTGQRQCQPGGKQGAENERGGHAEGISVGGRREKRPAPERGGREPGLRCPMAIFALREYAVFLPGI